MMVRRLPAALCLLLFVAAQGVFGEDDFSLGDALDGGEETTKKPQPTQPEHGGGAGGSFVDGGDAGEIHPHDPDVTEKKPTAKPNPAQPGAGAGGDEKKPTAKPHPAQPGAGAGGDDFHLGDALDGDEKEPTKKPQPAHPGHGGGAGGSFGDDDLGEVAGGMHPREPNEGDAGAHGGEEPSQGEEKKTVLASVLSTVGVALVGAVSSYIAYQKKKLCFKGQADDPENVNMDAEKGDPNDPQAQNSLLVK